MAERLFISRWRLIVRPITALLAVMCAYGVAGIHAHEFDSFTVGIHFEVDRSIRSNVIARELKEEAESLWRPYGVGLDWTDLRPSEDGPNSLSVDAIVKRQIEGLPRAERTAVLGLASGNPATARLRPILVSFDATEHMLERRRIAHASTFRIVLGRELSRALGRVLAHEIGHVLLGAPYHEDAGLMRAAFSPDDLGNPDRAPFRLTCTAVARLKGRIRALTAGPRFASAVPEDVDGSEAGEDNARDRAPCIPGHLVR